MRGGGGDSTGVQSAEDGSHPESPLYSALWLSPVCLLGLTFNVMLSQGSLL